MTSPAPASQSSRSPSRSSRGLWLLIVTMLALVAGLAVVVQAGAKESGHSNSAGSLLGAGSGPSAAILNIDQVIDSNSVRLWQRTLDRVTKLPNVEALILRINSPGGTVASTQALGRSLDRLKEDSELPIVAVVEDVAASGAYWLAASADSIFVLPGSIVGSIGVVSPMFSIEGLMEQYGIKDDTVSVGEYKTAGSLFQDLDDDERAEILRRLTDIYEQFLAAVFEGREGRGETPITMVKLREDLAEARLFNGSEAIVNGLADFEGGQFEAIEHLTETLRDSGKLGENQKLNAFDTRMPSIWEELGTPNPFGEADLLNPSVDWIGWILARSHLPLVLYHPLLGGGQ